MNQPASKPLTLPALREAAAGCRACDLYKTGTQCLESEIAIVMPHLLVLLGATAAQALLGRDFRVSLQRGRLIERPGLPPVMPTVHRSSILRAADDDTRELEMRAFVADLTRVAQYLERVTEQVQR